MSSPPPDSPARSGRQGCTGLMAQEFGDHPEVAGERMRWARRGRHRSAAAPAALTSGAAAG